MHLPSGFYVSEKNDKMGKVWSISMNLTTCNPNAPCYKSKECYVWNYSFYPAAGANMDLNTRLLKEEGKYEELYTELTEAINKKGQDLFRWNVSGDLYSIDYLNLMVRIAEACPNCKFWVFTKQYKVVEEWGNKPFPPNFNLILSQWLGYKPSDELKERYATCHVYFPHLNNPIPKDAFPCSGECEGCQECFRAKAGRVIVIEDHSNANKKKRNAAKKAKGEM